jgi:hypothetical protein
LNCYKPPLGFTVAKFGLARHLIASLYLTASLMLTTLGSTAFAASGDAMRASVSKPATKASTVHPSLELARKLRLGQAMLGGYLSASRLALQRIESDDERDAAIAVYLCAKSIGEKPFEEVVAHEIDLSMTDVELAEALAFVNSKAGQQYARIQAILVRELQRPASSNSQRAVVLTKADEQAIDAFKSTRAGVKLIVRNAWYTKDLQIELTQRWNNQLVKCAAKVGS